ncbi:hypothetical protein Q7P37_001402 [Cladosporium fusiforme]
MASPQQSNIGCNPNSISPSSWIPGFSDKRDVFACAIAANSTSIVDKMSKSCCKNAVQEDDTGCFHWCTPKGKNPEIEDWAACIADNVYTETIEFGQACNGLGDLEVKSALSQDQEPMKDAKSAAPAISASWKVGVLLGLVGLVQVMA